MPLIAAAGGEGVTARDTALPAHPPASPGPAEPPDPRSPALQSQRGAAAKLPPGHLPEPGAGGGAILHDFISLPSNFSVLRQQGLEHPHTGCPQSCGNQQQGQIAARWWHLRPPASAASTCTVGAGALGQTGTVSPAGLPVLRGGTRRRCRQPPAPQHPRSQGCGVPAEPHESLGSAPLPALPRCC